MSGDEYDEQSLDDEIEERLKSPANEALERLLARERPTDDDVRLGEPFYKKIADQERVPFLKVSGGFYIGFNRALYPYYLGGDYARLILQNNARTFVQDRPLSINELVSGGAIGSGGIFYGDAENYFEGHDDDDNNDWATPYQQSEFEGAMERKDMRLYVAETKKMKAEGATVENNPLYAHLMKLLGEDTHQGNIKSVDAEEEKRRQTVFHDIRNFYKKLEGEKYGTEESRIIMAHFGKHIRSARGCYYYTGSWKFRFS